jgi:uncharacterized membrane protein SpoIIM required for sporulation
LAHFQREELLGRDIDVLNIKWGWRVFKLAFFGNARNVVDWYLHSLPAALSRMKRPILVTLAMVLVGAIAGSLAVNQYSDALDSFHLGNMDARLQGLLQEWPLFSTGSLITVWWQNIRALLLGMVLGAISLSILGMLPALATAGVLGFMLGLVNLNGIPILTFFAGFILPHGLFEIPAMVIATAAILQTGALLATPRIGKTIGEVWITSFGEWAKIMVGVVIPLLFVAAAVEVWVTPRVAYWIFN